jgi:hypothetical protein
MLLGNMFNVVDSNENWDDRESQQFQLMAFLTLKTE